MERVHGKEDGVIVLEHKFHHLVHTAPVVLHPDQSSENADSVIYMHYVVAYIEGTQFVDGKLFALFDAAAHPHPVEAVEYLVVRIYAATALVVYETVVQVLAFDHFRHRSLFGEYYASESFQLRAFFSVYIYLISLFEPVFYILYQQVEILVERRLRTDVKAYRTGFHSRKGSLQIYLSERGEPAEEFPFPVGIGGVQPDYAVFGKDIAYEKALRIAVGSHIPVYFHLVHRLLRELRICVEGIYLLYFVAEKGEAEWVVEGI